MALSGVFHGVGIVESSFAMIVNDGKVFPVRKVHVCKVRYLLYLLVR